MTAIPTSTKLTMDATSTDGEAAIRSVFMIYSSATGEKGTGFLLRNGLLITNQHVVGGSTAKEVVAISSFNGEIDIKSIQEDPIRDLAYLEPAASLTGGFYFQNEVAASVGSRVETWGFPLAYSGPNPLLSVGHIAGYREHKAGSISVERLVINGAFNQGHSGGPLIKSEDQSLIGVVVAKHAPLTNFQQSALKVLAAQKAGFRYTAQDDQGNTIQFSEAQLVVDVLHGLLDLTQVMLGEAVALEELAQFLNDRGIDVPYAPT